MFSAGIYNCLAGESGDMHALAVPKLSARKERDGTLPLAVDADFERFIAARRALLNERLAATDVKAKGGLLPDVMLERGVLKITPIEKSTPPEAEALAARLDAMPAAHPDHRSPIGGGAMDAVHRLFHPSADGRNCRR